MESLLLCDKADAIKYSCIMGTESTYGLSGLMFYIGPAFQRCVFVEENFIFRSCLRLLTPPELPYNSGYSYNTTYDYDQSRNDYWTLVPKKIIYVQNNHSSIFLDVSCNAYIKTGDWFELQQSSDRLTVIALNKENAQLVLNFLEAHARAEN